MKIHFFAGWPLRAVALCFLSVACHAPGAVHAEALTVKQLIEQAEANHPLMHMARTDVLASQMDAAAVERRRWPSLSAVVEAGSASSMTSDSRFIRLEHVLWDAGRLAALSSAAEVASESARARVLIQRWQLSLQLIDIWQVLAAADGRMNVAKATLQRLQDYEARMARRVHLSISPSIDLELARARLRQTDAELASAQTARKTAISKLRQLITSKGVLLEEIEVDTEFLSAKAAAIAAAQFDDADWELVASNSPQVAKARLDRRAAELRFSSKRAERYPEIYVRVDRALEGVAGSGRSTSAHVGLRYSPGAGFSTFAEASALEARIVSSDQAVDAAQYDALVALRADADEFKGAYEREPWLQRSVESSRTLLESYERQFTAGRKSWQELMNAARDLAQAEYALVDLRAAMAGTANRLLFRMGV